jgi:hypothetical protein
MRRSARSPRRAVLEGPEAAAREDLALARLSGGLWLANSGLGAGGRTGARGLAALAGSRAWVTAWAGGPSAAPSTTS